MTDVVTPEARAAVYLELADLLDRQALDAIQALPRLTPISGYRARAFQRRVGHSSAAIFSIARQLRARANEESR